ncbi:MAG: DUF3137 domain-containing protein [Pseudomonadota bacterium]
MAIFKKRSQTSLELITTHLRPIFDELESERKKVVNLFHFTIFFWIIVVAVTFFALTKRLIIIDPALYRQLDHRMLFIPVAIVAISFLPYYARRKSYRRHFKTDVVSKVVRLFGESFSYQPDGALLESYFIQSQLINENFNRYKGEDYIAGKIDNIPLEFCELDIRNVTGSGKNRHEHIVFRGIFFCAQLAKNFKGRTFILPDKAEQSLGKFFGNFIQEHLMGKVAGRGELVKLENPIFEKLFVVYGDDQVEARYHLTPKVMENIVYFYNKYHFQMAISFKGNRLYTAIFLMI